MSLSSLNARFLALATASVAITLMAIYTSGDRQATVDLLRALLPVLAVVCALLVITRRYWVDARRVE